MAELPFSLFGVSNHSSLVVTAADVAAVLAPLVGPLGPAAGAVVAGAWDAFTNAADAVGAAAAPYARAATFLHIPALDAAADGLAASVGQDAGTLKYLLTLLAAYPLAVLFTALPGTAAKNAYSLITGVVLAQFVFGAEWVHAAVAATGAYVLMIATAPLRRSIVSALVVFVWMMGYLTAQHLYRLHVDYLGWSLDITGPMMLMTIKLSSLGFQLHDAAKASSYDRAITAANAAPADKGKGALARIVRERKSRAIASVPGPLEYYAYVFCFATFFAGPAFDFSEYRRSVSGESLAAGSTDGKGTTNMRWGSRLRAAFGKLFISLLCLAGTAVGQARFPFASVYSSAEVLHGPTSTLLTRYGWAWVCLFFTRCKYYFAWLMTEGSANLAGFGFRHKEGDWAGVQNIDILGFEAAPTITGATLAWNQQTQQWLARYCSQRLPRSVSKIATYALSAFWHGFYPGYYMAFLSAPLLTAVETTLGEKIAPRFAAAGKAAAAAYGVLARVVVSIYINYMIMPFVSLAFNYAMVAWASVYFFGHVSAVIALALLACVPRVRAARAPAAASASTSAAPAAAAEPPSSSSKKAKTH